jgi:hypothetical protein
VNQAHRLGTLVPFPARKQEKLYGTPPQMVRQATHFRIVQNLNKQVDPNLFLHQGIRFLFPVPQSIKVGNKRLDTIRHRLLV